MQMYVLDKVQVKSTDADALDVEGGIRSASPTAGIGYRPGAGGTVTQLTSKSTAVTLNKITGEIITNNAALAADAVVTFTLNNSTIDWGSVSRDYRYRTSKSADVDTTADIRVSVTTTSTR